MPCFVHFFRFRQCKNYQNRLRFDRVAVKCTLLRFMNQGRNVGFNFFQVRCAHKSGDVINFIILAYKNYKNRLRLAKVMAVLELLVIVRFIIFQYFDQKTTRIMTLNHL